MPLSTIMPGIKDFSSYFIYLSYGIYGVIIIIVIIIIEYWLLKSYIKVVL